MNSHLRLTPRANWRGATASLTIFYLYFRKKHRPVPQRAPVYVEQSENGHDSEWHIYDNTALNV